MSLSPLPLLAPPSAPQILTALLPWIISLIETEQAVHIVLPKKGLCAWKLVCFFQLNQLKSDKGWFPLPMALALCKCACEPVPQYQVWHWFLCPSRWAPQWGVAGDTGSAPLLLLHQHNTHSPQASFGCSTWRWARCYSGTSSLSWRSM